MPDRVERMLLRHDVALALIAAMLLFMLATLPFTLVSLLENLTRAPADRIYAVSDQAYPPAAVTHSRLHIAIVAIDEVAQVASLRVSGTHICRTGCDWNDRVIFFSIREGEAEREGLPPSAAVTLAKQQFEVTQRIELPIRGHPTRYPFDTYELELGAVLQRTYPDGSEHLLTPAEAAGQLFLSVQDLSPRLLMAPPVRDDPQKVRAENDPFEYLYVVELHLSRPLYLQVLTMLLVLLVAAAAAYAVFLRPLHELIINSGGLILGVWGIRGIMVPGGFSHTTAVDLALSAVIIFLLGAISVRMFTYYYERNSLRVPGDKRSP
jgi:hypothetical protein